MGYSTVYCEQCGEDEAEVILKYANLCGDCTAKTLRYELTEIFPYPICGQPIFRNHRIIGICCVRYGQEHDH